MLYFADFSFDFVFILIGGIAGDVKLSIDVYIISLTIKNL